MKTLESIYGLNAEKFFKQNFTIKQIEPSIEYKNDLCVLDWSNEEFYLKIFLNPSKEKIEITSLIASSFEDNLLEDWLIIPCCKLIKEYSIEKIIVPDASESAQFILSNFGFSEEEGGGISCGYDKLNEYYLWKTGDLEEPEWHKNI